MQERKIDRALRIRVRLGVIEFQVVDLLFILCLLCLDF